LWGKKLKQIRKHYSIEEKLALPHRHLEQGEAAFDRDSSHHSVRLQ